jgi:hypothetical protein
MALNATSPAEGIIQLFPGQDAVILILGTLLLIVIFFIVIRVFKNIVANVIIGGVGLVLLHFLLPFLFGIQIPLSVMNVIIALVGGAAGLAIILVLTLFGV